jgi:hypothetical protein
MTGPRMIVPTVEASPERVAATTPSMSYHGGHLLANVEVFTIFWGHAWSVDPLDGIVAQINQFFDFIVASSLMDMLAEYSAGGVTIGQGSRIGTLTVADSEPGGTTHIISDSDIQSQLQAWVNAHRIPPQTTNTLYFTYLPPGVTSTMGGSGSCTGYCGYHNRIADIYYAVEPYIDCGGCNFTGSSVFTNLTKVSSHELCEAVTDPDLDGWYNADGEEVGDVCNGAGDVQQLGGWYVQSEWSNAQGTCALAPISSPPAPFDVTPSIALLLS